MANQAFADARPGAWSIDPRRSLAAGALWLIVALAVAFAAAAGVWVGRIARQNVLEQHIRRLSLETDQLSSDLGQALSIRLDAVRAAALLKDPKDERGLRDVFDQLLLAYPDLDWIALADAKGTLLGVRGSALRAGENVAAAPWFESGRQGPWLGVIDGAAPSGLGDVAMPIHDRVGESIGVAAAHLRWPRTAHPLLRLTEESGPNGPAQAFVLDRRGIVVMGPEQRRGQPWMGRPAATLGGVSQPLAGDARFETMPDGAEMLVARAPIDVGDAARFGWRVLLREPRSRVFQRADALAWSIVRVSLGLGAATCLLGAFGALHLTRRLKQLTRSVARVGVEEDAHIEVPGGQDEVARLASAFRKIHSDLQRERRELKSLSGELERRVAVRSGEVVRLAEESRYAAIVRERLKMARDLHDTLAHSMMAMVSEIRALRRLYARDAQSIREELTRAEQVALDGLNEARSAIAQMRANTVRESGLGPALESLFAHFLNRTAIAGEFQTDPGAAHFGDERAEVLLQMAQEGLRNIERHSQATSVAMSLRVIEGNRLCWKLADNGVGFDASRATPGHFGLLGLIEQAQLIGAELAIEGQPGSGTVLTVTVPLSPVPFQQSAGDSA